MVQYRSMGDKPRKNTDPALQQMIDRYVRDALEVTGTTPGNPRDRFARASEPPPVGKEAGGWADAPSMTSRFAAVTNAPDPDLPAVKTYELLEDIEAPTPVPAPPRNPRGHQNRLRTVKPPEFQDEVPTARAKGTGSEELVARGSVRRVEFIDEVPTDTCDPPVHIPDDDEDTVVYSKPPPR